MPNFKGSFICHRTSWKKKKSIACPPVITIILVNLILPNGTFRDSTVQIVLVVCGNLLYTNISISFLHFVTTMGKKNVWIYIILKVNEIYLMKTRINVVFLDGDTVISGKISHDTSQLLTKSHIVIISVKYFTLLFKENFVKKFIN